MISAVSPGGEADTGRAGGFQCRADADAAVPAVSRMAPTAAQRGAGIGR
jgi:hypothetical protein